MANPVAIFKAATELAKVGSELFSAIWFAWRGEKPSETLEGTNPDKVRGQTAGASAHSESRSAGRKR